MRAAFIICFLGVFASAQTELPREILTLSRIKQKMRENLAQLPNYTCVETIVRAERSNASQIFRPKDSLRVEVLHAGDKELYAWPGTKKYVDDVSRLIGGGTTSSGEFALHARSIFLGEAQYKYAGPVTIRGRAALKYDYQIPLFLSGMTLSYAGAPGGVSSGRVSSGRVSSGRVSSGRVSSGRVSSGRVSMSGSFWADAATLDLLRLDVHAGDIPPNLPYRSAVSMVDYGLVRIGKTDALLPQSAEVELDKGPDGGDRNQIHFSQCRGFGAESEIRFDAGANGEVSASAAGQFEDFDLPPGLVLPLRLSREIDSQTAVEGDSIEARIDDVVKRKGEALIPAGAIARGRIRRLESYTQPRPYLIVGLEFSEIEFQGKRAAFIGMLDRVDQTPEITWFLNSSKTRGVRGAAGVADLSRNEGTRTAELPGVGTFLVDGIHFRLPAGFQMIWRTIDLQKR